jgi:hypothetical protein
MEEIMERYTQGFILFYAALILATWVVMIFAVLVDLWTGLEKAKAKGEDISSGALRRTVNKIGDYWRVQVFGVMIDVFASLWLSFPVASLLCGLGVVLIEFRSVIENLREKRSSAADIPEMVRKIIKAKKAEDASAVLDDILKTEKAKEE